MIWLLIGLLLVVSVWFGRILGPALLAMVFVALLPVAWIVFLVWASLQDVARKCKRWRRRRRRAPQMSAIALDQAGADRRTPPP